MKNFKFKTIKGKVVNEHEIQDVKTYKYYFICGKINNDWKGYFCLLHSPYGPYIIIRMLLDKE